MGLASVTVLETNRGHRVYYSTTGLTNSWTTIGSVLFETVGGTSNVTFSLTSLGWAANTSMYIAWIDDNGNAADGDYTIDDFSVTPVGGATPPQYLTITQSGANEIVTWTNASALLLQTTVLQNGGLGWTTNVGATSPFTNAAANAPKFYKLQVP